MQVSRCVVWSIAVVVGGCGGTDPVRHDPDAPVAPDAAPLVCPPLTGQEFHLAYTTLEHGGNGGTHGASLNARASAPSESAAIPVLRADHRVINDAPLVGERVLAVIESFGPRLVRAKGFVHLAGDDRRGFVARAGIRTELRTLEPWGDARRATELVLIGADLDEGAVQRALWACRAGA